MASNDNTDVQMEDIILIQLKNKLRRWKMKTTGVKADLIRRLQTAIAYEEKKDNNLPDDDETDDNETDNGQRNVQHNQQEAYVLTFKDVEDTIGTFDSESAKTIDEWIESFEDAAKLCKWNNVQKMIYAKKLLRGEIFQQKYLCNEEYEKYGKI